MEITGENRVEMNTNDMKRLGIETGDRVSLISPNRPEGIAGLVQETSLVRPGCVAVSFHFGHSQFGGSSLTVKNGASVFMGGASVFKGDTLIPEPRFTKGLNSNDIALLDENLNRTPMVDLVGGIPDFSSTRIKVVKTA
jgi:tetrathionate reductase subunit A